MNKYKSCYLILAFFLGLFTSCEDNRMDGMVDDKIFVVNEGFYTVEVDDFGTAEYNHAVYKSGIGAVSATVSFSVDESLVADYNAKSGTSYQVLPTDCYSIENMDVQIDKGQERGLMKIVFDTKAIYLLQKKEQKYVLPLKMSSDSPNLVADSARLVSIISPKIMQPLHSFSIKGKFDPNTYYEDGSINGKTKVVSLFKLIDGVGPKDLTAEATFSENVTISPALSEPQDFNNPVTYTLTNDKGLSTSYTVQFKKPNKLAKGIRPESAKILWKKTMKELGYELEGTTNLHMAVSLAVSGDNFIINKRYYQNYIYDWNKGEKIGEMNLDIIKTAFNDPDMANGLSNYISTNDSKGNILLANLVTKAGADFKVFQFSSPNDNGKEIISSPNNTAGQIGRKLSVFGDLNKDAKIYTTEALGSSKILVWTVKNGVVVDQTPQVIQSPFAFNGIFTDALANGLSDNDRIFLLNKKDFVQLNPVTGVIEKNSWTADGGNEGALDIVTFNGVQYLAKYWMAADLYSMKGYLYNIDNPDNLALAYKQDEATVFSGMPSNGNGSGDIVLQVLSDGYRMIMYTLLTNGGVVATLFDCVEMDTE